MRMDEWVVLAAGIAGVGWVNWYFFVARAGTVNAASAAGGVQEVTIRVRGGYDPARVTARKGVPLRLVFDRRETSSCSEEIVFPAFGIRRYLPAHESTAVELKPEEAGSYEFTCGMGMLRGKLIVEE
ncbi:MAG: cupredoxin domain-containing protein [Gemmatimonadetes bacterium]|nr:cupredoxin domain-containing protein [Gemmatimonadota bacterium]